MFKNYDSETFLLRQVVFNVVSILTGTGYVTTNYSDWGGFPLIFFLVLMFIGGCAGSTACGLKIFRIHILYKFFVIQLISYSYNFQFPSKILAMTQLHSLSELLMLNHS